MKLIVNPGLSVHPFLGESVVPLAVCEVPDGSGRPRRYLVPQQLCELLYICDGQLEHAQAVAAMADRSGGRYTPQQIEQLTGDFLIPRQVLLDPELPSTPAIAARRLDRYLFLKIRFLKRDAVLPIAARLGWFFCPTAWKSLIALILATHVWFYLALVHGRTPQIDSLPNSLLPSLLLLLSLSALVHEFGHATALTKYGGRSAEIGIGIYICFLALFVDLSEAWRLTNRQRVIVDVGGMYFQAILLILVAVAFAATGSPLWSCCFLITDIQIVANMNPLLRLDGYWALADGLGIPNLRRRSVRYVLFPILRRQADSPGLQASPLTLLIMRGYLVLTLIFSVYLIQTLALQCSSIVRNYPHVLHSALHSWRTGALIDALTSSLAALWRGMILISIAVLLIRAVMWMAQQARRPRHHFSRAGLS